MQDAGLDEDHARRLAFPTDTVAVERDRLVDLGTSDVGRKLHA